MKTIGIVITSVSLLLLAVFVYLIIEVDDSAISSWFKAVNTLWLVIFCGATILGISFGSLLWGSSLMYSNEDKRTKLTEAVIPLILFSTSSLTAVVFIIWFFMGLI